MSEIVVSADTALIASEGDISFSWRAVFAGAIVASAVIVFLLFLGAGMGLSLFSVTQASLANARSNLTLGAIYFFAAQAFGLAVGGYLAGRLMGPILETEREEIFHSSTHGLVTWAVAVMMTVTMVALSGIALAGPGLNAAAILGASDRNSDSPSKVDLTGYWVDTLFRPASIQASTAIPGVGSDSAPATAAPAPAPSGTSGRTEAQARQEVGRILTIGLLLGDRLGQSDHDQVAALLSQFTGLSMQDAGRRLDDVQNRLHRDAAAAAEGARRLARFLSLWLAASLVFGGLVASAAAMSGRWVDDKARA